MPMAVSESTEAFTGFDGLGISQAALAKAVICRVCQNSANDKFEAKY